MDVRWSIFFYNLAFVFSFFFQYTNTFKQQGKSINLIFIFLLILIKYFLESNFKSVVVILLYLILTCYCVNRKQKVRKLNFMFT